MNFYKNEEGDVIFAMTDKVFADVSRMSKRKIGISIRISMMQLIFGDVWTLVQFFDTI